MGTSDPKDSIQNVCDEPGDCGSSIIQKGICKSDFFLNNQDSSIGCSSVFFLEASMLPDPPKQNTVPIPVFHDAVYYEIGNGKRLIAETGFFTAR